MKLLSAMDWQVSPGTAKAEASQFGGKLSWPHRGRTGSGACWVVGVGVADASALGTSGSTFALAMLARNSRSSIFMTVIMVTCWFGDVILGLRG